MEQKYLDAAKVLKAIADPKRLQIVDMLSDGEICAGEILESFDVTQPTLSHDMKILTEAGIVKWRKDWKKTYYSLNTEALGQFMGTLSDLLHTDHEQNIIR